MGIGLGLAKPEVRWTLISNHAAGLIFLRKNDDYDEDEDIYDYLNLDDDEQPEHDSDGSDDASEGVLSCTHFAWF